MNLDFWIIDIIYIIMNFLSKSVHMKALGKDDMILVIKLLRFYEGITSDQSHFVEEV